MVRHIVRLALVQGLLLGTLPALGPDRPSEETVSAPAAATATAEAVVDTREAAEPISEKVDLAATGEGKTITDGEDANQPATIVSTAFDPNADPNLVAWWKLDGDTADSSGHGLDGQPKGEPQWVEGRIGGAVELDGVDDYIDCGSPPRLAIRSRLTVACWVKIASFTRTWETILAKGDNSYRLGRFRDTSRGVHFACTGTDPDPPWLNSVVTLADDRWHHIAGVYDGASIVLYVDGREVARKAAGGAIQESEQPLCLGENSESGGRFLRGLLDDVRIYDRALRQEEIVVLVGPHVAAAAGAEEPAAGVIRQAEDGEVELPGSRPGVGTSYMTTVLLVGGLLVLVVAIVMLGMMPGRKGQGGEPGMVWKIARKEFLLNVMTFKFAVATVACLVLAAVFTPILAVDYQRRLKECHANVAANEAELHKVSVYQNITPAVYRPPNVLSIFGEGLEKQLGQSAQIKAGSIPETETTTAGGNPFLSTFPTLDVMLIVKVVVGVLALLIAYDTISGEREQGTLKLMLANTAARTQVLVGKLLAGLMTLIIPVTMAFILTLLILQFFPLIHLAGADWVRVLLIYFASLVFVSTMYNISLLFSCLAQRSNVSLVFVLLVWVVLTTAIPSASVYLSSHLRPTEARKEMDTHVNMLKEECDDRISNLEQGLGAIEYAWGFTAGAFGERTVLMCDRPTMDYCQKKLSLSEPIRIGYADRVFEVQQRYLRESIKRKHLTDTMARISPIILYENVVLSLAGTDLWGHEHFRTQVKAYGDEVVTYIRSRTENFSSPSYFVPRWEEGYLDLGEVINRFQTLYGDGYLTEFEKFYSQKEKQIPSLDLRDLPRFTFRSQDLARTVRAATGDAMLLLLLDGLVFLLAFMAFQTYDVR